MNQTPEVTELEIEVDLDSLTLGEIDEIEDRTELSFMEIVDALQGKGKPVRMGKLMRAFALVQLRRTNPDATWEDTAGVRATKAQATSANPTLPPPVAAG